MRNCLVKQISYYTNRLKLYIPVLGDLTSSSYLLFGRCLGLALVLLLEGGGLLGLELPDEGLGGADFVARRQQAAATEICDSLATGVQCLHFS